jgi:hypothetical protein
MRPPVSAVSYALCASLASVLTVGSMGQTGAPPSQTKKSTGQIAAQTKASATTASNTIRGIVSAQMGFSGAQADGRAALGEPVKVLTTSKGKFELRATSQTRYYGFEEQGGNRIWQLGGEYEAVGRLTPGSRSRIDGVQGTLEMSSIRLLNANPPEEAETTKPSASTVKGKVTRIDAAIGRVQMERPARRLGAGAEETEPFMFDVDAATSWVGAKAPADLFPGDVVSVAYLIRDKDGRVSHNSGLDGVSYMLMRQGVLKVVATTVTLEVPSPGSTAFEVNPTRHDG